MRQVYILLTGDIIFNGTQDELNHFYKIWTGSWDGLNTKTL